MAWLNREITWAANSGPWQLLEIVGSRCEEFNAINVATALHRLARHREQGALQKPCEEASVEALLAKTVELLAQGEEVCNARAVSTIAHAVAGLGCRDKVVARALVVAAKRCAESFDRQGLANSAWAFAKLPRVKGTTPLARRLALVARGHVRDFLPQELSSLAWSLGRLGVKDNRLMSMISEAVRGRLGDFNAQGLTTIAAAFGRIGVFIEPLLDDIGAAAQKRLGEFNGRDTVQLLWAFAKFKKTDAALFEALCGHADGLDLRSEGQELVVSFLWSFGTLHWVPSSPGLLVKLLGRAEALTEELGAHRTVRLLTALAKLRSEVPNTSTAAGVAPESLASLAAALAGNVALLADRMSAQEVGISAWALATLRPRTWKRVLKALFERSKEVLEEANWWSIAHLEYACWRLSSGDGGAAGSGAAACGGLLEALTERCAAEAQRVREESDAFQDGPAEAAVELAPWTSAEGLQPGARVLVFGPGSCVRRSLKAWGAKVVSWRRFAAGRAAGASASAWPPEGPFDACAMRYPDSADAFELALNAVAAHLPPGAPLWLYGDIREGALGATRVLRGLFELTQAIEERGDARLFVAARNSSEPKAPLEKWARVSNIDLGCGQREWTSFPGLFAAGLVDVMTGFLLEQLAGAISAGEAAWTSKRHCRCLDFGCGTGVLAAGVLRHLPRSRLTLLDADSVALEAARQNLPDVEAIVLSDGLAGLSNSSAEPQEVAAAPVFDLIVSNPPVHRGHPDDLRVLQQLLLDAPSRLAADGELWLVAQEHIPVGRLFALAARELEERSPAAPRLAVSRALPTADGRFVVWRAALAAGGAADGEGSRPAKRRRKADEAAAEAAPAAEAAGADGGEEVAASGRPLPRGPRKRPKKAEAEEEEGTAAAAEGGAKRRRQGPA